MILLDTNIISAFARPEPRPEIQRWLDSIAGEDVAICAVSVAETRLGLAHLAPGHKRAALTAFVDRALLRFGRVCLPFDALAAEEYARVVVSRRKRGRPIGISDAQIAAIAVVTGSTLATLNVKDFEGIEGLEVIGPSTS